MMEPGDRTFDLFFDKLGTVMPIELGEGLLDLGEPTQNLGFFSGEYC